METDGTMSGYVIDAVGRAYEFGKAPRIDIPPFPLPAIASMAFDPKTHRPLYLMQNDGFIHKADYASKLENQPFFGWDIARDLKIMHETD